MVEKHPVVRKVSVSLQDLARFPGNSGQLAFNRAEIRAFGIRRLADLFPCNARVMQKNTRIPRRFWEIHRHFIASQGVRRSG